MGEDIYTLIGEAGAKTICESFGEALDAAEALYGTHIRFRFRYKELAEAGSCEQNYPAEIKERVQMILLEQRRRYAYLFE